MISYKWGIIKMTEIITNHRKWTYGIHSCPGLLHPHQHKGEVLDRWVVQSYPVPLKDVQECIHKKVVGDERINLFLLVVFFEVSSLWRMLECYGGYWADRSTCDRVGNVMPIQDPIPWRLCTWTSRNLSKLLCYSHNFTFFPASFMHAWNVRHVLWSGEASRKTTAASSSTGVEG